MHRDGNLPEFHFRSFTYQHMPKYTFKLITFIVDNTELNSEVHKVSRNMKHDLPRPIASHMLYQRDAFI